MKKKLSVLICLIIVLAIALPVMAACETEKVVQSLDFDNPQKNYTVGDTIDYDSWKVKITYTDGTTATKTVKELVADGAELTKADLTKEGNPTVYLVYKQATARVVLTVSVAGGGGKEDPDPLQVNAFTAPDFYTNYVSKSKPRTVAETQDDFRITGVDYEVGTANKFIFKPTVKALDLEHNKEVEDNNPTTVVKVYSGSAKGSYTELTGDELTNFVTIEDNTYKFSKDGDKYVKLEISLDSEKYDVAQLTTAQRTITVEFKLIDDGYNVYDQIGLSVMADLEKIAWSEIWKCDYEIDSTNNVVNLTATEDTITLKADDKPICEYVGNVSTVILHASIKLDPTQMPSLFFWTDGSTSPDLVTSDMWTEAYQSLTGHKDAQDALAGSLRDGANTGKTTDRDYMRVMDTYESSDEATRQKGVHGNVAIVTGLSLNMQKSFFATSKVSVSGNYQSITSPARGTRVGGRILEVYVDYEDYNATTLSGTKVTDPQTHWAVFQMHQSVRAGADKVSFEIRNIAFEGNNPEIDDKSEALKSAGLLLCSTYTPDVTFSNINATQFFTNMLSDGYGDFHIVDGKISSDSTETTIAKSIMKFEGVKMYNSYSNMVYTWRSSAELSDCEFIGAGGPLFIMCDGGHELGNPANTTDEGGCALVIDSKSVLQSYAEGTESWYATYNVNALFTLLKKDFENVLEKFGKTILFDSPDPKNESKYLNLIAAMICSPGDLLKGGDASSTAEMLDPRGVFTQLDAQGEVANKFALHNDVLAGVKQVVQYNAKNFPLMAQAGNAAFLTDLTNLYQADVTLFGNLAYAQATGQGVAEAFAAAQLTDAQKGAWATTDSNMIALYMSAASLPIGSQWSPYFGVILELGSMQK